MKNTIESYYVNTGINPFLLKQKLAKFSRNPDLQSEFAYWIANGSFSEPAISIEGYTAAKLASLSPYLNGEGAYMLMIELRESPKTALRKIQDGFYML